MVEGGGVAKPNCFQEQWGFGLRSEPANLRPTEECYFALRYSRPRELLTENTGDRESLHFMQHDFGTGQY